MSKIIALSLIRRWDDKVPTCIRSVLNQTYENWTFYIIASQDSAQPIGDFIANEPDVRGRIILLEHQIADVIEGFELLKDLSLELAPKGDFFCNLDGDDAFALDFMEESLHALERSGTDIAFGAAERLQPDGSVELVSEQSRPFVCERKDFPWLFFQYYGRFLVFWGKLYRSSLFTPDVYDQIPPYRSVGGSFNDSFLSFSLLSRATSVIHTAKLTYRYSFMGDDCFSSHYHENSLAGFPIISSALRTLFLTCVPQLTPQQEATLTTMQGVFLTFIVAKLFPPAKHAPEDGLSLFHSLVTSPEGRDYFTHRTSEDSTYCDYRFTQVLENFHDLWKEGTLSPSALSQHQTILYDLYLVIFCKINQGVTFELFVEQAFTHGNIKGLTRGTYSPPSTPWEEEALLALLAEMEG